MFAAVGIDVERRLIVILIQLSVILLVARIFAVLFRRIKQPAVIGEITAGLLLGPSFLGWVAPGLSALIFLPDTDPLGREAARILQVISQLGLILLLFLIGLEFDFNHLKTHAKSAAGISAAGIALPFVLGFGLAQYLYPHLGNGVDARGFMLFLGISMSITALPVLARMLQEFGITRTRLGTVAITAAAGDDAVGWILLAGASAMVTAKYNLWNTLRMTAWTAGFVLFLVYIARPALCAWARAAVRNNQGKLGPTSLSVLLTVLFACSILTSYIGIFTIFGAFLLGAVLSDEEEFRNAVAGILHNFVLVFFLPIFFTYTGLRTDVGLLTTAQLWAFAALVLMVAVLGKLGGCTLAARVARFPWKESFLIGSMMNTRGLVELIVLNVGYDLGVIPPDLFTMLVLMALLTTVMTTPLLYSFRKGTELERPLNRWFGIKNSSSSP